MKINLDIFPIEIWRLIYEEFIGDYKIRKGEYFKQINIEKKKHLLNLSIPKILETTIDLELDQPIIRLNEPTIYEIKVKCWRISILLKLYIENRREDINPNSLLYFYYNNPLNKILLLKTVFELVEQKDDYLSIIYEEYPNKFRMYIGDRILRNC
jgi:hypothetical protein